MPDYRLYFLGPGGRIMRRDEFEAHDDAQAIGLADRKCNGSAAELWQSQRKVKTFTARK